MLYFDGIMVLKESFLPGMHFLCGRAKKSTAQRLKEQADALRGLSPSDWHGMFEDVINVMAAGRKRVFDRATTFWTFLGQVLQGGTCRSATRQVQVSRHKKGLPEICSSDSAYCQARARLDPAWLENLGKESVQYLDHRKDKQWDWDGRRVLLVDGTSCQLPDTPKNQESYPQHAE